MKKIVFLVYDPGGHDAVNPLVGRCNEEGFDYEFFCIGPSAVLSPEYAASKEDAINSLKNLVSTSEPICLVTGTSWGSQVELEALTLFKEAGIPTFSVLDYWANYSSRFKQIDGSFLYPDYYIVMDSLAYEEAVSEGVPSNIIKPLGHPGLDKWIHKSKAKFIDKNKKNILFLSQPLFEFYGNSLGFSERDVLEDMCEFIRIKHDYLLSVKFHPKESLYIKDKFAQYSVEGSLLDILPHYHIVIGMNTMGLLQSALTGTETISYQPNLCVVDDCITNKLGLTVKLTSFSQLLNYMSHERNIAVIKQNNEKYIWQDGNSTKRVFDFIKGVLQL